MANNSTMLKLPREIRDEIHGYVLLEHKYLHPFSYHSCSCDCGKIKGPYVPWLRVNKQINEEGTVMLYGKGKFRLKTNLSFMPFFSKENLHCSHCYPKQANEIFSSRHLIKHLSLELVPMILPESSHKSMVHEMWDDENFLELTPAERRDMLHSVARDRNQDIWKKAILVLKVLRGLENVILDIEQIFCPTGCCRMVGTAAKAASRLGTKKVHVTVMEQLLPGENARIVKAIESKGVATANDAEANGDNEDDNSENDSDDDEDRYSGIAESVDSDEEDEDDEDDDDAVDGTDWFDSEDEWMGALEEQEIEEAKEAEIELAEEAEMAKEADADVVVDGMD